MVGNITVQKGEYPGSGEVLIYIAYEGDLTKDKCFKLLDDKVHGKLSAKAKLHEFTGKEEQMMDLELDDFYKHIILIGIGKEKDFSLIKWRNALTNAFKMVQSLRYKTATISYYAALDKDYFEIGKQLAVVFYLSNYHFDVFKSVEEKKKIKKLETLSFLIPQDHAVNQAVLEKGITYGADIANGIYLTRNLVNQPASHLHPETLVQEAFRIEKESKGKIKVEVLDEDECRRLGMGSFLGVAQGSDKPPKFIILKYQNSRLAAKRANIGDQKDTSKTKNKKICLIGKSITFDSGGLSLKPPGSMETMKMDMAGGATVLGIFDILAHDPELFKETEIYGILPACENMPSGKALRPGDVVTALNKKIIEVLNTDAEGRLALADALSYAEEYIKPDKIIDIATLTGACMVALGADITGMWGNDEKFLHSLEEAAKKEGEELWKMPLYKPYLKKMKSDIADFKNVEGGRYGGAITAALFLAEFVKKAKWVHLDIAGSAFNEGSPHDIIPKGGVGWGVLTLTEYLRQHSIVT